MQLLYVFGVSHNDNQSSYYDQLTEVAEIFFYPTVAILLDEGLDQTEWRFYEVETSGDSANWPKNGDALFSKYCTWT